MNNKTKKQIWEELQMYKKKEKQYKDFWEVEIIDEYEKHLRLINKIIRVLGLIFLLLAAFFLGMVYG